MKLIWTDTFSINTQLVVVVRNVTMTLEILKSFVYFFESFIVFFEVQFQCRGFTISNIGRYIAVGL